MATREREKALKRRENAEKRPHAVARYVRISHFPITSPRLSQLKQDSPVPVLTRSAPVA